MCSFASGCAIPGCARLSRGWTSVTRRDQQVLGLAMAGLGWPGLSRLNWKRQARLGQASLGLAGPGQGEQCAANE